MAIRVMAGFEKGDSYWLPRGRAHPKKELCGMIWPWLEGALELVNLEKDLHPTACYFLNFLDVLLRCVILQDAAAMFCYTHDKDPAESWTILFFLFLFSDRLYLRSSSRRWM